MFNKDNLDEHQLKVMTLMAFEIEARGQDLAALEVSHIEGSFAR